MVGAILGDMIGAPYEFDRGRETDFHDAFLDGNNIIEESINRYYEDSSRETGKGQLKVRPDITRITISLEGLFPEYGEALRRSSEDTECIRDLGRYSKNS